MQQKNYDHLDSIIPKCCHPDRTRSLNERKQLVVNYLLAIESGDGVDDAVNAIVETFHLGWVTPSDTTPIGYYSGIHNSLARLMEAHYIHLNMRFDDIPYCTRINAMMACVDVWNKLKQQYSGTIRMAPLLKVHSTMDAMEMNYNRVLETKVRASFR